MDFTQNIHHVIKSPLALTVGMLLTLVLWIVWRNFMDIHLMHGNMWKMRSTIELVLFVVFLVLFWLFIAISVYKAQYFWTGNTKELGLWSIWSALWMLVMWCPACSITLASYIWLASIISLLPYKWLELKVLWVFTLVYVIYSSLKTLHTCSIEQRAEEEHSTHLSSTYLCMKQHMYRLIFLQAIVATLWSLYYGWFWDPVVNIASWDMRNRANGLTPCELCRFARILMYPLVVIIWVGWIKKKFDYRSVLLLSWVWIIIETYQYRFQMTKSKAEVNSVICGVGESASCAATDVIYQWFITIPFLCLVAFIVIFLGTLKIRSLSKSKKK